MGRSPYEFAVVNQKIVELARNAVEVIRKSGRRSPAAKRVVEELLCEFKILSKHPEMLSHVNVSTLLHRTAQVMTKMGSVGILSKHHPELLENLIDGVYTWHHMFEPRHTATAIWSFGRLGRQILPVTGSVTTFPGAFSCLVEKAAVQAEAFSSKEITSIFNGIAALELTVKTCEHLIKCLLREAHRKLYCFGPRELATFTWALASMKYDFGDNTSLLDESIEAFHSHLRSRRVGNQELANFMWGLAKLGYKKFPLRFYKTVADELPMRLSSIKSLALSNLLWAFGKLRFLPSTSTLQATAQHVAENMEHYEPQQVSKVLCSFAIFGKSFDALAIKAKTYFASKTHLFGRQELCNLLWALAILDELDVSTFSLAMSAIQTNPNLSFDGMGDIELRQLHDCLVDIRCFSHPSNQEELMQPEWENMCVEAYKQGQGEKMIYATALSVLLTLQKMGSFSQCRQSFDCSSKVMDIATDRNGLQVGIEISIPMHYFINDASQLKGQRLWAMRIMEAQGFVILRVDCKEWAGLSQDRRVYYIKGKLGMD